MVNCMHAYQEAFSVITAEEFPLAYDIVENNLMRLYNQVMERSARTLFEADFTDADIKPTKSSKLEILADNEEAAKDYLEKKYAVPREWFERGIVKLGQLGKAYLPVSPCINCRQKTNARLVDTTSLGATLQNLTHHENSQLPGVMHKLLFSSCKKRVYQ